MSIVQRYKATLMFLLVLENQVGSSKKHLDQYKAMLAANEEALAEMNKVKAWKNSKGGGFRLSI